MVKPNAKKEIVKPQTLRAQRFMERALYWARRAAAEGETPVGAVVVCNGRIIGHGYNRRERLQSVTEHAELMAIRQAERKLGSWRLPDCELYVTLEPCFMCASAIQQARIARVFFAARDPKGGALVSLTEFYRSFPQNHRPIVEGGLMAEEASQILRAFFQVRRAENRARKRGHSAS